MPQGGCSGFSLCTGGSSNARLDPELAGLDSKYSKSAKPGQASAVSLRTKIPTLEAVTLLLRLAGIWRRASYVACGSL